MIEKKLADFKKRLDPIITHYLDGKIRYYQRIFPDCVEVIKQIKDLTLRGGDRIRPALFYYGYRLWKKPNKLKENELIRLSVAFEFYHSFALIHDDILDNSSVRRNRETVHKYFNGKFGRGWGEKFALLAGDLAESFCQNIFQSDLFKETIKESQKIFVQLKEEVVVGEIVDTILPKKDVIPNSKTIRMMMEYKSGNYSIQKPLLMGLTLAQAPLKLLQEAASFSRKLGFAFQLQDDILGIFGDDDLTGKSGISDIIEGKRTLLVEFALKRLTVIDKKQFIKTLGKPDLTTQEIHWFRNKIIESGALDFYQHYNRNIIGKVKQEILKLPFKNEAKEFLLEFSNFIIDRQY